MTHSPPPAPKRVDPRRARTRSAALASAREIVAADGALGLTYTTLAARSGITRQTLYSHWPTIQGVMRDLLHEGPRTGYPDADPEMRVVFVGFLRSWVLRMNDKTISGTFSSLIAQAEQDPLAEQALQVLIAGRVDAVRELLVLTDVDFTAEHFSRLMGPVIFRRFVYRQPVTDEFIDGVVDAFLSSLRT